MKMSERTQVNIQLTVLILISQIPAAILVAKGSIGSAVLASVLGVATCGMFGIPAWGVLIGNMIWG